MPILNLPAKCVFNAGAVAGSGRTGPDDDELELEELDELLEPPPPELLLPPPPPQAAKSEAPPAVSKRLRRLIEAVSFMNISLIEQFSDCLSAS